MNLNNILENRGLKVVLIKIILYIVTIFLIKYLHRFAYIDKSYMSVIAYIGAFVFLYLIYSYAQVFVKKTHLLNEADVFSGFETWKSELIDWFILAFPIGCWLISRPFDIMEPIYVLVIIFGFYGAFGFTFFGKTIGMKIVGLELAQKKRFFLIFISITSLKLI
jgi:hypothetical protein